MLGFFKAKRARRERATDALVQRLEEKSVLVVDKNLIADLGVGRKTLYRIIYDLLRRERMFMLADGDDQMVLMTNNEFNRFMLRRGGRRELPSSSPDMVFEEAGEPFDLRSVSVEVTSEEPGLAAGLESVPPRLSYTRSAAFTVYCDEDGGMFAGATLGGASRGDFWEVPAAALDSTLPSTLYPTLPEPLEKVLLQNGGAPARPGRRFPRQTTARHAADRKPHDIPTAETVWMESRVPEGASHGPDLPSDRQNPPPRQREPWPVMEEAGHEVK